jgi:hypothetical protein
MALAPLILTCVLGIQIQTAAPDPTLEDAAVRFVRAWADGEGKTLEGMMREAGVRIHLLGEDHRSISPRQARAALEDFMKRYPQEELRLTRTARAEGDPNLGLAELRLSPRAPQGGGPVIFTLFVGFALEGGEWVVTEVRILS